VWLLLAKENSTEADILATLPAFIWNYNPDDEISKRDKTINTASVV
jgi:hypothetical protein